MDGDTVRKQEMKKKWSGRKREKRRKRRKEREEKETRKELYRKEQGRGQKRMKLLLFTFTFLALSFTFSGFLSRWYLLTCENSCWGAGAAAIDTVTCWDRQSLFTSDSIEEREEDELISSGFCRQRDSVQITSMPHCRQIREWGSGSFHSIFYYSDWRFIILTFNTLKLPCRLPLLTHAVTPTACF